MSKETCAWNCNRWQLARGRDFYNKRRTCTCGASLNRVDMMAEIEKDLGPMNAENHSEYVRRIKKMEAKGKQQ